MKDLDVVVPVYNERSVVPELHRRLVSVLEGLPYRWSVIYVEDGSTDGTDRVVAELCEGDRRVRAVHLSRNFGQQLAIAAGLEVSDGDATVVMDGDLQDPPEVIPDLAEAWEEGHSVVYGVKRARGEPWHRRVLFGGFHWLLQRLSPLDIPPSTGNFSLLDRSVVRIMNRMPERRRYMSGLRAYVGGSQTGVEFDRPRRYAGEPGQTFRKLVEMAADAFFAFSDLPLRIATGTGFLVAALAGGVLVWVLYERLVTGRAIPGWASVMTSVLFLGAVQLIAVGILGEYVGRIYDETKGRPRFVVRAYRNVEPPETAPHLEEDG